jgi:PAS domain S-box-containing protein
VDMKLGASGSSSLSKISRKLSFWLTPLSVSSEEDSKKVRLLMKTVLAMFVTNSIGFLSALLEPKNKISITSAFYGLVYLALIGFLILLKNGKTKFAGCSLIIFSWSIVAFAALFFGGLRSQMPVVFGAVIMLMGSIFGGRAAFILALVTIVFFGVIGLLESNNLMPTQLGPGYSPLNAWSALCVALLLMSLLLDNSLTSIKESEERYQLALQGSAAGVWDWNIVTNDVYYSSSFKEMLDYSSAEFPNKFSSFSNACHPNDFESMKVKLESHLESSQNRYDVELRLRTKNDDYRWFHVRGEAVRNKQSKPVRMVGSIIDVTVRKIAEESNLLQNQQLLKTNEELDQFVYSASHDLRAPISSLLGLIEVARLENAPPSIKRLLDLQERSLIRLDKVIYDIVNYSRNNRVDLEIEEIHFRTLLNDIFDQLQFMNESKGLNRVIEIDQNVCFYSDRKRLNVILNNLISNAIRYSHGSTQDIFIKTIVAKSEEGVSIHVIDLGEGIDQMHIPKIFDMFYRASERSSGSGIGLYITKEVVQKLQGSVEVRSQKYQGSEFIVRLPNLKDYRGNSNT